jgi:hypothetical protein
VVDQPANTEGVPPPGLLPLAYEAFTKDKGVAIRATAENLGVSEAVARHIVEINPRLSLQQVVGPRFELSLLPGPGNPGAAGMIQQVGDFLLAQGIIKAKIDGRAAVGGTWVAEHLKTKR